MKKIFLTLAIVASFSCVRAQNTFPSSGNVGIGTTTPSYKLDVFDPSSLTTYPLRLLNAYGTSTNLSQTGVMFSVHDSRPFATITGGQQVSGTYAYGRLDFGTRTDDGPGVTTKLSILNNGNVGIGTTNPDQLLTVKGNIHAQQVNVDLNFPAGDYVFEPTYKLPDLTALKSYLDKNHHLPEIPTANEMAKNGMNLGDMNELLLKKVEELTLYLIDLKNDNEELKKQNASIKKSQQKINKKLLRNHIK